MKSPVFHILLDFLVHIPLIVVWIVGFVFALLYLGRHPKVALCVMGALGLSLITSILVILARWAIPEMASDTDDFVGGGDVRILEQILEFLRYSALAVGYSLLLLAAFGWRREESVQPASQLPGEQGIRSSG